MTRYVRLYQKVGGKERYSDSFSDYKIQSWMFFIYKWKNRCLGMKEGKEGCKRRKQGKEEVEEREKEEKRIKE